MDNYGGERKQCGLVKILYHKALDSINHQLSNLKAKPTFLQTFLTQIKANLENHNFRSE